MSREDNVIACLPIGKLLLFYIKKYYILYNLYKESNINIVLGYCTVPIWFDYNDYWLHCKNRFILSIYRDN